MKKLLFIVALLIVGVHQYCSAQTRNQLTPTGLVKSISPFTTLTGSGENNMLLDTLKGGTLAKFQNYHFEVYANVTTTGLNISSITINVKIGGATMALTSGLNIALAQTNKPFVIKGDIVNQGNGNAYIYAQISQDGTTPINTVVSYYDKRQISAINFGVNQIIAVTSTVAGLGLGTTTIGIDWIKRNNL